MVVVASRLRQSRCGLLELLRGQREPAEWGEPRLRLIRALRPRIIVSERKRDERVSTFKGGAFGHPLFEYRRKAVEKFFHFPFIPFSGIFYVL